jgi:hypothetical protein
MTDVDPPVLRGDERKAEHQSADDRRRHRVGARGAPAHGGTIDRYRVSSGASPRPSEIDEHVQAEQREPDHGSRAVKTSRILERLSV